MKTDTVSAMVSEALCHRGIDRAKVLVRFLFENASGVTYETSINAVFSTQKIKARFVAKIKNIQALEDAAIIRFLSELPDDFDELVKKGVFSTNQVAVNLHVLEVKKGSRKVLMVVVCALEEGKLKQAAQRIVDDIIQKDAEDK